MQSPGKATSGKSNGAEQRGGSASRTAADLNSGMELLELDFLLGVIENTNAEDNNDVTMRKLSFNEILRRDKQDQVDSGALKAYAINQSNTYGKDIQCQSMKELTKRTQH